MSLDVTPLRAALHPAPGTPVAGANTPAPPATDKTQPSGPAFADVFELEVARANREVRRAGDIPVSVWEEVEAANRLFDELQADGRRVVFDDGRLNGRLVISLCDLEGRVLRSVAPSELVGRPPLSADTARLEGGAA